MALLDGLVLGFVVIFVAELGDKSQLIALTFATRYRFWVVLAGITAATAVVHLFSVALGAVLGATLPTTAINVLAGLAFIAFGLWTLRGDKLTDDETERALRSGRSAFWAIAGTFFLAELGDKTMLATVALATDHGWFGTWLGSTFGMVAADAIAIGVGALLGSRLPEKIVRYGAAALFFAFGAWLLWEAVRG